MDIELIINMIINYMIQLWFKQATETAWKVYNPEFTLV